MSRYRWIGSVIIGLLVACGSDAPLAPPATETEQTPPVFVPDGLPTPVAIFSNVSFQNVAAGSTHTCGLGLDGRARCWGAQALGITWRQQSPWPVMVEGDHTYASLAAGTSHSCATTPDGAVYCWGRDLPFGPLQNTHYWTLPVLIETEKPITGIVAGASFSCGLREGRAVCWGQNGWGQLGSGSTSPATALVEVSGNVIFESLGRTQGHTVCGITPDRRLYCWGRADTGQLAGAETTQCNAGRCVTSPQLLLPELRFTAVATGPAHTCAITTAGEALCWGLNGQENRLGSNQIERGEGVVSEAPMAVLTDERFTQISVGVDHACALSVEGFAYCWGSNRNGQLGSGLAAPWWYPSAALGTWNAMPLSFSSISAGQHYTCGVSAFDSRIFCWGRAGEHLGMGQAS